MSQLTFDQSVAELRRRLLLSDGEKPQLPIRMPSPDDDELDVGLSFFRTFVEGDYSGLCLPRTFFCRSEIRDCSFRKRDTRSGFGTWAWLFERLIRRIRPTFQTGGVRRLRPTIIPASPAPRVGRHGRVA